MQLSPEIPETSRETRLTLVIFFISYPLFYLAHILLSRWLGPEHYGDFAVAYATAVLGSTMIVFAMDKAAIRYLSRLDFRKQAALKRGLMIYSVGFIVSVGGLIALLNYGAYYLFSYHFSWETHPVRFGLLLAIPISLTVLFTKSLSGQGKSVKITFTLHILEAIFLLLLLFNVHRLTTTPTGTIAIYLLLISRLTILTILLWAFRGIWQTGTQSSRPLSKPKAWLGLSGPFMMTALMITLTQQSGIMMLEVFHDSEVDVGIYSAARETAAILLLIISATRLLMMPKFTAVVDDPKATGQLLTFYLKRLLIIGTVVLVIFIGWGERLLHLFGYQYPAHGWKTLILLSIGHMFPLLATPAIALLQVRKKETLLLVSFIILLVMHLTLMTLLIPAYGMVGVAVSYVISALCVATMQIGYLRYQMKIPYRVRLGIM